MAIIRKRKLLSGRIVWQVDYSDREGKRRARQFALRKLADDYLVTVRSDLRLGRHVAPGASITVAEAGELWIDRGERDALARSTLRQYRQHLKQHINPPIGQIKLVDLTAPRVNSFADALLHSTSRATARKILTSLGSLVDEAIRRGLHAQNPVRAVKLPKTSNEEREGDQLEMPSKEELRTIVSRAEGRWRPLIVTAIFTGLRGSELRGLKWSDVDLSRQILQVRRRVDQWNEFGPPKSKAGKREVPLAPMVVSELRRWRLACPKGPLELVFPAPDGQVVSHSCILKDGFGPLQLAAGFVKSSEGVQGEPKPKYALHALRHAAAALFIEQGLSPKRVQTIMGHASIKMTYDVYGYLFRTDADDLQAMREIEARFLQNQTSA